MSEHLADLDELVLRCRHERARSYIQEAVACYRAGAFRASIVATWVAVAYDIVDKFHELALSGDNAAEQQTERFERIRRTGDLAQSLAFERDLLDLARDQFELVSHLEHIDLSRLQEDRHRCAHPSMSGLEEPYEAPAELARTHIRSAVRILLERPPVQGRAALERLKAEVDSSYFPNSGPEAADRFRHGPLARPRESLVRGFAVVLIKGMLIDPNPGGNLARRAAALSGVRRLHRPVVERVLQDDLPTQLRRVVPEQLNRVVMFVANVEDIWDFIPPDIADTLSRYVDTMPAEDVMAYLPVALRVPGLRPYALQRLQRVPVDALEVDLFMNSDPAVIERRIDAYLASRSWATANARGQDLQIYVASLTEDQVRRLIAGGAANDEVRHSFGFRGLMRVIYNQRGIAPDVILALLRAHGFGEFADELAGEDGEAADEAGA
ncbi:MAG TPA: hypothetical protein VLK84_02200 [Longimicrobium sp.]|nr:hypothetical protein [Longimicrobium sp.]